MSEIKLGVGKLMGDVLCKYPEPDLKSRKIVMEDGRTMHFWTGEQLLCPPFKTTILVSTPLATSGLFEIAPGHWGLPDKHIGCEFYYCIEGVCTVEDEGVCKDIHAGEMFYIAPGAEHRVFNHTDKVVRVVFTVSGGMESPDAE